MIIQTRSFFTFTFFTFIRTSNVIDVESLNKFYAAIALEYLEKGMKAQ